MTFHLNFQWNPQSVEDLFPLLEISLITPDGKARHLASRHFAAISQQHSHLPLIIAERHISGVGSEISDKLKRIERVVHFYHPIQTNSQWAAGSYRLKAEFFANGHSSRSRTESSDVFEIQKLVRENDRTGVAIRNIGPNQVSGTVVNIECDEGYCVLPVIIPAKDCIFFDLPGSSYFIYCEGRHTVPVGSGNDWYIRNQKLAASPNINGTSLLVSRDSESFARMSPKESMEWDQYKYPNDSEPVPSGMLESGLIMKVKW